MADDCLFCGVVAGSVPSDKVLETEHAYAFRDINPATPVHVLVAPKEHIATWHEIRPDQTAVVADVVQAVQQVAVQEGIADDGYRVVANVGRHGGMTVAHLHLHVMGGRPLRWPPE